MASIVSGLGESEDDLSAHGYICCTAYCAIARNWALRPWQFRSRKGLFHVVARSLWRSIGISCPQLITYVQLIWCTRSKRSFLISYTPCAMLFNTLIIHHHPNIFFILHARLLSLRLRISLVELDAH
jgi:hypothetical protein